MTDCIIKTKDLSMDACRNILSEMKIQLSIASTQIKRWEMNEKTGGPILSEEALDEMKVQRDALRNECIRLSGSLRQGARATSNSRRALFTRLSIAWKNQT